MNSCTLSYINDSVSHSQLDTEVLYAVASGCKNLEGLSVAGLTSVDDQILFALAENCPKLYYLNLKGCRMVNRLQCMWYLSYNKNNVTRRIIFRLLVKFVHKSLFKDVTSSPSCIIYI